MKVELITTHSPSRGNRLSEFPQNKLGIIREWSIEKYIGNIVILQGNVLYCLEAYLGGDKNLSWSDWSLLLKQPMGNWYIEVLPPGTEIKITI